MSGPLGLWIITCAVIGMVLIDDWYRRRERNRR